MRKRPPRKPLQIRAWRKQRGLTQDQVIAALPKDYSSPSLSRLENGKFAYTQETLEMLAQAFECAPHELFLTPSEAEFWRRMEVLTDDERNRAITMLEAAFEKLRAA